jgi:hypothetical protein
LLHRLNDSKSVSAPERSETNSGRVQDLDRAAEAALMAHAARRATMPRGAIAQPMLADPAPAVEPRGAQPHSAAPRETPAPAARVADEPGRAVEREDGARRAAPAAQTAALASALAPPAHVAPQNAAGAPAAVIAPLRHEALAEAIVARARALPANGALEVRFALEPADLGPVRIRIETLGQHVRIEISAASRASVDALAPGLARLAADLQEAGFRKPEITLGLDFTRDPGAEQPRHGQADDRDDAGPSRRWNEFRQETERVVALRSPSSPRLDRTV